MIAVNNMHNGFHSRFADYLFFNGGSDSLLILSFINEVLFSCWTGIDVVIEILKSFVPEYSSTGIERWLWYFDNGRGKGKEIKKALAEDPLLSTAKDEVMAFWADENVRELHFKYERHLMDAYSDEHTYEFLLEQERARAERAEQAKREMALEMLKMGIEIDRIVKVSGLSEKEIRDSCE
ncbi:hypothetical protein AGMMS50276_01100 [Synergistales bacterium]|nr:hypothetical protein AGMMS50276_01100 [Synergistales bacterium]